MNVCSKKFLTIFFYVLLTLSPFAFAGIQILLNSQNNLFSDLKRAEKRHLDGMFVEYHHAIIDSKLPAKIDVLLKLNYFPTKNISAKKCSNLFLLSGGVSVFNGTNVTNYNLNEKAFFLSKKNQFSQTKTIYSIEGTPFYDIKVSSQINTDCNGVLEGTLIFRVANEKKYFSFLTLLYVFNIVILIILFAICAIEIIKYRKVKHFISVIVLCLMESSLANASLFFSVLRVKWKVIEPRIVIGAIPSVLGKLSTLLCIYQANNRKDSNFILFMVVYCTTFLCFNIANEYIERGHSYIYQFNGHNQDIPIVVETLEKVFVFWCFLEIILNKSQESEVFVYCRKFLAISSLMNAFFKSFGDFLDKEKAFFYFYSIATDVIINYAQLFISVFVELVLIIPEIEENYQIHAKEFLKMYSNSIN